MQEMLLNWKTSLSGLGLITAGISHLFTALSDGRVPDFYTEFGLIVTGIGLLTAKDGGVSGTAK